MHSLNIQVMVETLVFPKLHMQQIFQNFVLSTIVLACFVQKSQRVADPSSIESCLRLRAEAVSQYVSNFPTSWIGIVNSSQPAAIQVPIGVKDVGAAHVHTLMLQRQPHSAIEETTWQVDKSAKDDFTCTLGLARRGFFVGVSTRLPLRSISTRLKESCLYCVAPAKAPKSSVSCFYPSAAAITLVLLLRHPLLSPDNPRLSVRAPVTAGISLFSSSEES